MSGLSDKETQAALAELPGWRVVDGELVKNFKFGTFREAIAFINRIADKAEAADHHPDLTNHYNRVRVAVHTWTENA
ncbi:MAG: 4a-hydroxytetrahydrobiopterin dehydratase, partial [Actinomycetota bacterium]